MIHEYWTGTGVKNIGQGLIEVLAWNLAEYIEESSTDRRDDVPAPTPPAHARVIV
jgi:hypothetical protein